MRLPIAFRDNQQISLADSTISTYTYGANTLKHPYTYSSLTGYEPRLALTNPYKSSWNISIHSYLESTYPCLSRIVYNTTGNGTL